MSSISALRQPIAAPRPLPAHPQVAEKPGLSQAEIRLLILETMG
ncbi:hypothetical protein QMO56_22965 [Roseomonas sp. E05]|nr:hypothetical protein [Roseomonas sp. E05]MDJ0390984.1 hypothetical protein [Roseomonas sp. E05]